jgi:hypothetical protein
MSPRRPGGRRPFDPYHSMPAAHPEVPALIPVIRASTQVLQAAAGML